ncbi:MAG: formate dehydrogenase accessory protein FdhE [Proteobacteria bacterium]|nr:formate dehydrogenase accessory protein FdhE [Pseudomonadota bacterium]
MGDGTRIAIKELDDRVRALIGLRPPHKEILGFCGAILKEQLKAQAKIGSQADVTLDRSITKGGRELPMLQSLDVPIDFEAAKRLFRSLCRVAKGETQPLNEEIGKIQKATRRGKIDMDRFLREMTRVTPTYTGEVSSSLGLNRDILIFLGRASIQPFLMKVASLVGDRVDLEGWTQGNCPICGYPPSVSELAETEGRRILICSLCGFEWKTGRMTCPFCSREDTEAHRYLFLEGDDAVRIDVCEVCKKYIKTIDVRKMGHRIFPVLEDIGTIHLDMLAQEEGYERGSPSFLEVG